MTVHSADEAQPTNLPLGVSDLALSVKDGPPITGNRVPYSDEKPLLFTVRLTNKPEGVKAVAVTLILSQLGKGSNRRGTSGEFSKYDWSTTYEKTVPIESDAWGHSIKIEIAHAAAPSGGFHGGDGPYDVYMSFTPVVPGAHDSEEDESDDDENGTSQTDEALRYTFYNSQSHCLICFLDRFFMWFSRVWDVDKGHAG